ncbi:MULTISPECIES: hypothetical protein [unclassified Modicisalibacter]|uniref:hypothetical protein n=1 Tax=unclassified Modicisalibacter TaxID=2679913 RepID=UPI001CC9C47D|nr:MULTISPECIES: hypothetical protein [unclassified Modicisalibacter]MBZ9558929.1 hypothetical protein [Modicisalibacter sp. R2A 31.J]MBZ9575179.1 hypothetical protein [Modicisalibacter sp. MOD 31.J]
MTTTSSPGHKVCPPISLAILGHGRLDMNHFAQWLAWTGNGLIYLAFLIKRGGSLRISEPA